MKRKIGFLSLLLVLFASIQAYAYQWDGAYIEKNQSVLLEANSLESSDNVYRYGRGDYLAEGSVKIANMQDGTLRVEAATLAHINVDRIIHSIFLDMWDADENDWINLNYWDFEIFKEDVEDEELHMLETTFILTGYEVGRYYRLRGLHGVEIYDELEACATETDGVLLTDLWN